MPAENRSTSSGPNVYVPPKRGSSSVYVAEPPFAVEFVSVALVKPAPKIEQAVPAGFAGSGGGGDVSSNGVPPLKSGFTHPIWFHAANSQGRVPPPVGVKLNV